MNYVIWSGLVLGGVYALVAISFTVTLVPTGVFNFAQGALVVGGSFLAYQWLHAAHLAGWLALVITFVIGIGAGSLCELITVRPLRRRLGGEIGGSDLVTTVGMSIALVGLIGVLWGYTPLLVPFLGPNTRVNVISVAAAPVGITVLGAALALSVALHLWFKLTRTGRACLAVAEDREAAGLRGINVGRLSIGAFAAGGGIAALSGFLTGPITYATPELAITLAIGAFVAIALGGPGSFIGALVASLIVGLVSSFATNYIGASYGDIAVFAVLVATLVIRPHGLGGFGSVRHV